MGPQHTRCGKNVMLADAAHAMAASMGPQHTRCGKAPQTNSRRKRWPQLQWGRNILVAERAMKSSGKESSRGELQWGRNILVAERPHGLLPTTLSTTLQWGRNILVAESPRRRAGKMGPVLASMGPQHTRCGKLGSSQDCASGLVCFNGAATYSLRKAASSNRTSLSNSRLQWGRNILVAESLMVLLVKLVIPLLQWGRNILVAESTLTPHRLP